MVVTHAEMSFANPTAADGSPLADVLRVLGSRPSGIESKANRDRAAHVLLAEMEQWAPMVIWKAHGRGLRELGAGEVESLIADAVQALALAASTSRNNFRGQTGASARAWCRRVLLNHVSNELRSRQARRSIVPADFEPWSEREVDLAEPPASSSGMGEQVFGELAQALKVVREVREKIRVTHRARDAESCMRALWCYLAYLSGSTLDEQVRALGGTTESDAEELAVDPATWRRLRNRVYKLRERGRKVLLQVYERMRSGE
jgi:hypothetical protein